MDMYVTVDVSQDSMQAYADHIGSFYVVESASGDPVEVLDEDDVRSVLAQPMAVAGFNRDRHEAALVSYLRLNDGEAARGSGAAGGGGGGGGAPASATPAPVLAPTEPFRQPDVTTYLLAGCEAGVFDEASPDAAATASVYVGADAYLGATASDDEQAESRADVDMLDTEEDAVGTLGLYAGYSDLLLAQDTSGVYLQADDDVVAGGGGGNTLGYSMVEDTPPVAGYMEAATDSPEASDDEGVTFYGNVVAVGPAAAQAQPRPVPASPGAHRADKEPKLWARLQDKSGLLQTSDARRIVNKLQQLVSQFTEVASAEGRIIIDELRKPVALRTIKPIDAGGIAGGIKFASKGLFFKVAVDEFGIYGGTRFAGKVASRELMGSMALQAKAWNLGIEGVCFPLMAIVIHRGVSLVVTSLLPIGKGTLVLGSDDGGITVHKDDPHVNRIEERLFAGLNLKLHRVGRNATATLHAPTDIEMHRGKDGRTYCLDTARTMPPDFPRRGIKGGFLYRLLRPELVATNPKPLSPDAFSRFGAHNSVEHNADVRGAAARLVNRVIPRFAERVDAMWTTNGPPSLEDIPEFIMSLHLAGINVRYLPHVRRHVTSDVARVTLLSEMIARACKNAWRYLLLQKQGLESVPTTGNVKAQLERHSEQQWLLSLFGGSSGRDPGAGPLQATCRSFWCGSGARNMLISTFDYGCLLEHEVATDGTVDLRNGVDMHHVWRRFATMVGLCSPVLDTPDAWSRRRELLRDQPLQQEPIVKTCYLFDYFNAYYAVEEARASTGQRQLELCEMAARAYQVSNQRFVPDASAFMNYAIALSEKGRVLLVSNAAEALETLRLADAEFSRAAQLCSLAEKGTMANIMVNWSQCLKHMATLPASVLGEVDVEEVWDRSVAKVDACLKLVQDLKSMLNAHVCKGWVLAKRAEAATDLVTARQLFRLAQAEFDTVLCQQVPDDDGVTVVRAQILAAHDAGAAGMFEAKRLLAAGEHDEADTAAQRAYRYFDRCVDWERSDDSELERGECKAVGALYNHALLLSSMRPVQGAQCVDKAVAKVEAVLAIEPGFFKALHLWATLLLSRARETEDAQQRLDTLLQARAKVSQCIELFPTFVYALEAWVQINLAACAIGGIPDDVSTALRKEIVANVEAVEASSSEVEAWMYLTKARCAARVASTLLGADGEGDGDQAAQCRSLADTALAAFEDAIRGAGWALNAMERHDLVGMLASETPEVVFTVLDAIQELAVLPFMRAALGPPLMEHMCQRQWLRAAQGGRGSVRLGCLMAMSNSLVSEDMRCLLLQNYASLLGDLVALSLNGSGVPTDEREMAIKCVALFTQEDTSLSALLAIPNIVPAFVSMLRDGAATYLTCFALRNVWAHAAGREALMGDEAFLMALIMALGRSGGKDVASVLVAMCDHEVGQRYLEQRFTDLAAQRGHRGPRCTFVVTGRDYFLQRCFECLTCAREGEVYCPFCIELCHKGHAIGPESQLNAYCDCGSDNAQCTCCSPSWSSLQGTLSFLCTGEAMSAYVLRPPYTVASKFVRYWEHEPTLALRFVHTLCQQQPELVRVWWHATGSALALVWPRLVRVIEEEDLCALVKACEAVFSNKDE